MEPPVDQPPAVALTALADAWPRAIETEIGAALCAIGAGRSLTFLIRNLCNDFHTSFITSQFKSPFLHVGRGVQGDYLSLLLFNLCLNTFIQHIKEEKYSPSGFSTSYGPGSSFVPIHLFQFAYDAAMISGHEQENQILLNRFYIWCKWAGMHIRVDKCATFGIRKGSTRSI